MWSKRVADRPSSLTHILPFRVGSAFPDSGPSFISTGRQIWLPDELIGEQRTVTFILSKQRPDAAVSVSVLKRPLTDRAVIVTEGYAI